jgi:hypothetical protein
MRAIVADWLVVAFSVGGDGAEGRGNLELLSRESSRRQFLLGASFSGEEEGVSMPMLLSDFVLFSFVVVLIAGLVLATASALG